jgi:hypothetical protein
MAIAPGDEMEFQDSEVSDVRVDAGVVVVKFSAAAARRIGADAGAETTPGYAQGIELVCTGARVLRDDDACIGKLSGGHLLVGVKQMRLLPLPCAIGAPALLELRFSNGAQFCVEADHWSLRPNGDLMFVESYRC